MRLVMEEKFIILLLHIATINSFPNNGVQKCPQDKESWKAKELTMSCSPGLAYHCLKTLSYKRRLVELCLSIRSLRAKAGCPYLRFHGNDTNPGMVQRTCKANHDCPGDDEEAEFFSSELYKYKACITLAQEYGTFSAIKQSSSRRLSSDFDKQHGNVRINSSHTMLTNSQVTDSYKITTKHLRRRTIDDEREKYFMSSFIIEIAGIVFTLALLFVFGITIYTQCLTVKLNQTFLEKADEKMGVFKLDSIQISRSSNIYDEIMAVDENVV